MPDVPARFLDHSRLELPIWLRALGVSQVSPARLNGNREPGFFCVWEEDRDTEYKGASGPDPHLGKAEKQHLLFRPPLIHAAGERPDANSDSWQSNAGTAVRKTCSIVVPMVMR